MLLDEMFSDGIAVRLRSCGHDVQAVVADPALVALPDEQVLIQAASAGRALVTANIKDFVPLDAQYKATRRTHAGLILVSTKTFRQDRSFIGRIGDALAALLARSDYIGADRVIFLQP